MFYIHGDKQSNIYQHTYPFLSFIGWSPLQLWDLFAVVVAILTSLARASALSPSSSSVVLHCCVLWDDEYLVWNKKWWFKRCSWKDDKLNSPFNTSRSNFTLNWLVLFLLLFLTLWLELLLLLSWLLFPPSSVGFLKTSHWVLLVLWLPLPYLVKGPANKRY